MNKKTMFGVGSVAFLALGLAFSTRVSAATLTLTPSSIPITAGQTVNVDIMLDTTGAPIDGVDVYSLRFNPSLLQVQDSNSAVAGIQIMAGALFPTTVVNAANNTSGTIQFSQVTTGGTSYTGSGKLATVTFKGLFNGTSLLTFDFRAGKTTDTNVAGSGVEKLTQVSGASLTVSGGTNNPNPIGVHASGTLILDGSTVWLIKDQMRYGFRNPEEYKSYGYNFSQVVVANEADLSLPQGDGVLKAMEGTLVIDASDNRTVYMVGTGATKRGFVSETVFKALGYKFGSLPKINLSDYATGAAIADANLAHPDGSLVLQSNGTIWWIRGNTKQGFESMAVFNTYGFSLNRVVPANSADLNLTTGALIKFRDGTIVSEGGTYYIISDGQKLAFSSSTDLTARGYKLSNTISSSLSAYESAGLLQ
jgi:hypothetical protein